jgi:hypothetical protein
MFSTSDYQQLPTLPNETYIEPYLDKMYGNYAFNKFVLHIINPLFVDNIYIPLHFHKIYKKYQR